MMPWTLGWTKPALQLKCTVEQDLLVNVWAVVLMIPATLQMSRKPCSPGEVSLPALQVSN
jgi:hypothetical protein